MKSRESVYAVDPARDPLGVLAGLSSRFAVRRRAPVRRRLVYLDTFDRRLARAGATLAVRREDGASRLCLSSPDGELELALAGEPPAFARELPPGPLCERLASAAGIRRLLPQVEVEHRAHELDVLDRREKTVARVRLEEDCRARRSDGASAWHSLGSLLCLEPVRGYDEVFRRIERAVPAGDAVLLEEPLQRVAARAVGAEKPPAPPAIRADLRADVGMKRIQRALLETALANEPGLCADLDPEFLHDFRVATRRARSLLGQVKRVFPDDMPDDMVPRAREELAWLGRATGETRDLDVFLLGIEEPDWAVLGERRRALRSWLRERKRGAHALLVAALASPRRTAFVRDWRAFLEDERPPPEPAPARAADPLLEVVSRRVWRVWRRLRERGAGLDADAPAAALHRVRLECKKLRYLVDCAHELAPSAAVERERKALKKLQDVLGGYNDSRAQIDLLERFARRPDAKDRGRHSLGVGRMIERLHADAEACRARFERRFRGLCGAKSEARWRALFARG
jgi:CHAD domain-containing protein